MPVRKSLPLPMVCLLLIGKPTGLVSRADLSLSESETGKAR